VSLLGGAYIVKGVSLCERTKKILKNFNTFSLKIQEKRLEGEKNQNFQCQKEKIEKFSIGVAFGE